MKVLIVSTFDIQGGAARAAYRLLQSLNKVGIDCQMLVMKKTTDDHKVHTQTSNFSKIYNLIIPKINNLPLFFFKKRSKTHFSPTFVRSRNIIKQINSKEADIVHLHWINEGFISVKDFRKIKAPIIWTLHDMWAFTGGCHYDENCGAFIKKCGSCKVLRSSSQVDLSRLIWLNKINAYKKVNNLTINCLSSWLKNEAQSSSLFKNLKIWNLPNPINTNIFKPVDKTIARRIWNLPEEKKLIMYGAMGATSDPRKGYYELLNAIKLLKTINFEVVIFGASEPLDKKGENKETSIHYMGHLNDEISLTTLYSAVDVMIVPSKQENLSNAIMESLACGTPIVAFKIGGNLDLIDHEQNGYLAQPFDAVDLAYGIDWVLENSESQNLSQNSVKKVNENFESTIVAKKYISLYQDIISKII